MLREVKILAKLSLANIYGLNTFKYSKDKKEKNRKRLLICAYVFLLLTAILYVSALSIGLCTLGLSEILPAYLVGISSLIMVFFGFFKAGPVLFEKKGLDILKSLPVSEIHIVISRFIRLYVENLFLGIIVLMPGVIVYGYMVKPGAEFYLAGFAAALFIPIIPLVIATFAGGLITYIASKVRHKSIISTILSLILVVCIFAGTSMISRVEGQLNDEMLQDMALMIENVFSKVYPPALWMGNAMIGEGAADCLLCFFVSILIMALTVWVVSRKFDEIVDGLSRSYSRGDYEIQSLESSSVLGTLYKKELKRYLASSIYVTNTIIGPVLGVVMSAAILIGGVDTFISDVPLPFDIEGVIPFVLAATFCMMPTTCTSVSMEGKEWWIVKSLPISSKTVLDSKILFNLSLSLPMLMVAQCLMIMAFKPAGASLVWMILIPVLMLVFSCVWGIAVNLKIPVFNWENEVTVVKQSASAAIGGLGGAAIAIVLAFISAFVPDELDTAVKAGICMVVAILTTMLYIRNNKVDLKTL